MNTMNANHTPGPWHTYQVSDGTRPIRQIGDDYLVASVIPSAYEATAEADARLIAAAPCLLTHLARVISQFDALENNLSEADLLVIGDAKATIAKATGKELA